MGTRFDNNPQPTFAEIHAQRARAEKLKAEGKYRANRHKPKIELGHICTKPKPRPAAECGDPSKWIRNATDELAIREGCYFDEALAEYAATWIETYCRHSKGRWAGEQLKLLPWQSEDIIYPIFGWLMPDGLRRINQTYIEVAKKNGKSTMASGIGLYMLVGDSEAGSHVFSAATEKEQASIVHAEAISMVEASDILDEFLYINRSSKTIQEPKLNLVYRAIAASPRGVQGLHAHCMICDELHAWRGDEFWEAIKYAGRSREQPLIFAITTAGDDFESQCRKQHEYAVGQLAGTIEDIHTLPVIYAADEKDELLSEETWRKANPSLGETMSTRLFAKDATQAHQTPRAMAAWKRYSLNIWSTAESAWLHIYDWDQAGHELTLDELEGMPCWLGLDLSRKSDLSALVAVFRDGDDYYLWPWFWVPRQTATKFKDRVSYLDWAQDGWCDITPREVVDYDAIEHQATEIIDRFNPESLLYDPYVANEFATRIGENTGIPIAEFKQTVSHYAHPTAAFERLLAGGQLRHNGNPVLRWQASHCSVYTDNSGNQRPMRPKQGDHRGIDGIAAAVMALSLALEPGGVTTGPIVWV